MPYGTSQAIFETENSFEKLSLSENMTQPLQMTFLFEEKELNIHFDINCCLNVQKKVLLRLESHIFVEN